MAITMTENWRFWHLISAALPVGAFQYSQGLETAIYRGEITSATGAERWLNAVMKEGVGRLDLPIIYRVYQAWSAQDEEGVRYWDRWSRAYRETDELRREELAMGHALARWAETIDEQTPEHLEGFTSLYAVLGAKAGSPLRQVLAGYLWMWAENMSLVVAKLLPLGHLEAQRMLRSLCNQIDPVIERAVSLEDDELGANTLGVFMMSARHETQASRLFRS
ncbi:MAG: urease accessory UreF family protein [Pseudomonadota bacterium]|nr:urease accessory UreF family protein [Pseudomonadota bacterium]